MVPGLILPDAMMPGMDGPTTLAALRREASMKEIPVIFMTGKVQPEATQSYRDRVAFDWVQCAGAFLQKTTLTLKAASHGSDFRVCASPVGFSAVQARQ